MTASNRSLEPATCSACGTTLSRRNNMRAHWKSRHPEFDMSRMTMDELCTDDGPGRPATLGRPTAALAVVPPVPAELPPLGVDDVDQIVLGLVDQLAGPAAMFPVEHLPALLAWRTATETFLRSVTRPRPVEP